VGELDRRAGRVVQSRFSGQGTALKNMMVGKFSFLLTYAPGADRLTYRHQGHGWRSPYTPPASDPNFLLPGPVVYRTITSQDNGPQTTWGWLCDRIREGAAVEIGFSFDDPYGRPRGGHAVRVFQCGKTLGARWIGYLHDKAQTDQDPFDCRGLEMVQA